MAGQGGPVIGRSQFQNPTMDWLLGALQDILKPTPPPAAPPAAPTPDFTQLAGQLTPQDIGGLLADPRNQPANPWLEAGYGIQNTLNRITDLPGKALQNAPADLAENAGAFGQLLLNPGMLPEMLAQGAVGGFAKTLNLTPAGEQALLPEGVREAMAVPEGLGQYYQDAYGSLDQILSSLEQRPISTALDAWDLSDLTPGVVGMAATGKLAAARAARRAAKAPIPKVAGMAHFYSRSAEAARALPVNASGQIGLDQVMGALKKLGASEEELALTGLQAKLQALRDTLPTDARGRPMIDPEVIATTIEQGLPEVTRTDWIAHPKPSVKLRGFLKAQKRPAPTNPGEWSALVRELDTAMAQLDSTDANYRTQYEDLDRLRYEAMDKVTAKGKMRQPHGYFGSMAFDQYATQGWPNYQMTSFDTGPQPRDLSGWQALRDPNTTWRGEASPDWVIVDELGEIQGDLPDTGDLDAKAALAKFIADRPQLQTERLGRGHVGLPNLWHQRTGTAFEIPPGGERTLTGAELPPATPENPEFVAWYGALYPGNDPAAASGYQKREFMREQEARQTRRGKELLHTGEPILGVHELQMDAYNVERGSVGDKPAGFRGGHTMVPSTDEFYVEIDGPQGPYRLVPTNQAYAEELLQKQLEEGKSARLVPVGVPEPRARRAAVSAQIEAIREEFSPLRNSSTPLSPEDQARMFVLQQQYDTLSGQLGEPKEGGLPMAGPNPRPSLSKEATERLMLGRVIMDAAEQGYGGVGLTPGVLQRDFYHKTNYFPQALFSPGADTDVVVAGIPDRVQADTLLEQLKSSAPGTLSVHLEDDGTFSIQHATGRLQGMEAYGGDSGRRYPVANQRELADTIGKPAAEALQDPARAMAPYRKVLGTIESIEEIEAQVRRDYPNMDPDRIHEEAVYIQDQREREFRRSQDPSMALAKIRSEPNASGGIDVVEIYQPEPGVEPPRLLQASDVDLGFGETQGLAIGGHGLDVVYNEGQLNRARKYLKKYIPGATIENGWVRAERRGATAGWQVPQYIIRLPPEVRKRLLAPRSEGGGLPFLSLVPFLLAQADEEDGADR